MPHRMLRPAATVLLASAPLFAMTPAQAASQQAFPCSVGVQKIDIGVTSEVTVNIQCHEARTVGVRITAGGAELANLQEAVQADVRQTVTLQVPKVPQVCATLQTGGESTTLCAPAAAAAMR